MDTNELIKAADHFEETIEIYRQNGQTPPDDLIRCIKRLDANQDVLFCRIEKWLDSLHHRKFEYETAYLFTQQGFKTFVTKQSNDGGVDVRASNNGQNYVIQCKKYKQGHTVKIDDVKALYATKQDEQADKAIMVTTSDLEPGAYKWAENHKIEVLDRKELIKRFAHYVEQQTCNSKPDLARNKAQSPSVTSSQNIDAEIIETARIRKTITNKDIREQTGLGMQACSMRLANLVKLKKLAKFGDKSKTFYTLPENDGIGIHELNKTTNARDDEIVEMALNKPFITNKLLREAYGYNSTQASNRLGDLVSKRLLVRHGEKPKTFYTHPKKDAPTEKQLEIKNTEAPKKKRRKINWADIPSVKIQDAISKVIKKRASNRSIIKDRLADEVCKELKMPRGKIRDEIKPKINIAVGAMKRKGVLKEYTTPSNVIRFKLLK